MGGAAEPQPAKGGKKALDAAINLVPYIDLLMTIMTFLMMTAVWTQIAMLQVQNASGNNAEPEEEEEKDKPKPIIVLLTESALKVQEEGGELQEFPQRGENPDYENAKAALDALKKQRPDRIEVKVQAEDGVDYTQIAKVIDICTGLDLTGITLSPVASGS
jgi:biopolymer transport protein ExbD